MDHRACGPAPVSGTNVAEYIVPEPLSGEPLVTFFLAAGDQDKVTVGLQCRVPFATADDWQRTLSSQHFVVEVGDVIDGRGYELRFRSHDFYGVVEVAPQLLSDKSECRAYTVRVQRASVPGKPAQWREGFSEAPLPLGFRMFRDDLEFPSDALHD